MICGALEFAHDGVTLLLRHVAVHGAHCEVVLPHLLSQPVHLPLGVAENDRLRPKMHSRSRHDQHFQYIIKGNE